MDYLEIIRRSLIAGADSVDVRRQLAELIASGVDKDEILTGLAELRCEFQAAGLDIAEDAILELMDFLAGWCAPVMRL